MKRTQKKTVALTTSGRPDSDTDNDCSCEILLDDSLSNVGDSDCDCSQCLEANLNAFNQLKNEEQNTLQSTKELVPKRTHPNSNSMAKLNPSATNKQLHATAQRYKSSDRLPPQHKNPNKRLIKPQNEEMSIDVFDEFLEGQFSNGQLNDFLMITRNRTRKFVEERNKLQDCDRLKKQELKEKIKRNLEMLKYTASIVAKANEEPKTKNLHAFKWNHSKYKCECNGEVDPKKAHQNCCRKSCRRLQIKQGLDTNLKQLKPDFGQNRQEILNQIKRKREQNIQAQKKQACPDKCPNHHNRTDKQKIKKIEQFIKKNVQKHKKKVKKQKKEQREKKMTIQGKLTAIDIKSKQILKRSKKYDDNCSRTSFRDSIDQFDTFSQLREENERRKKIKQDRKNMKTNPKMREQLLEKVYEDAEEEWELEKNTDQFKYTTKGQMPQQRKQQDLIDRIAYDAGITAPKNIKHSTKKENVQQKKIATKTTTKDRTEQSNLNRQKQEEEKKRIQKQIARKKAQIVQQYKKRNSNIPQNKQIRESYQQKLQKNPSKKKKIVEAEEHSTKEPYRTNYQTKAGKNADQIRAHGDPLIQEYTYHNEKQKAAAKQKGDDMEIFNANVGTLMSKKKLAV